MPARHPAEPSNPEPNLRRPVLIRLTRLRHLLRERPGRAVDLGLELGVHERTIRRDLTLARAGLGWDVEYDAAARSWILNGEPPALPAVPLSQAEAMALLVARRVISAYRGTPYSEALETGFDRILQALDASGVVTTLDAGALPVFDLDPVREPDPELNARLLQACCSRRRLELVYYTQSRNAEETRIVDPYQVRNHGGDWYLAAFCHSRQDMRVFAIGPRMRSVRETGETFEPDLLVDPEAVFRQSFGIFAGGNSERIVVRFNARQGRYIRERRWHTTQELVEEPDGGVQLRLYAPVNPGIVRWVLQHGEEAEVLEPESLRLEIADRLRRAAAVYHGGKENEDEQ